MKLIKDSLGVTDLEYEMKNVLEEIRNIKADIKFLKPEILKNIQYVTALLKHEQVTDVCLETINDKIEKHINWRLKSDNRGDFNGSI